MRPRFSIAKKFNRSDVLKKKRKKRGTTCKGRFLFVADICLGIDDVADGSWATPERSV
jgi:hypothetical protein